MPLQEIDALIEATIKGFRSTLPGLQTCERHGGSLAYEDVERNRVKLPAVLIALRSVDWQPVGADDRIEANIALAALIVTKDTVRGNKKTLARDRAGWTIATTLAALIDRNGFQATGAQPARLGRIDNLASDALLEKGVHVLALTWSQIVFLCKPDFTAEDGVLPADAYVGVAPEIGAANRQKYDNVVTGRPPPDG